MAFCSALHASSTLAEIKLVKVNGIDGFLGRRLPARLRELYYDHERHEFTDDVDDTLTDAVLADLAHALQPTRLEHLSYNNFGELAAQPCLTPMLSGVTSPELVAARLDNDRLFYAETWSPRAVIRTLPAALRKTNNETRCRLTI
ncbi:hypothetical protein SPRG_15244 [Saprolegnia parasitica CBS 223.65]|uniref:Uncharacterized protein n=1 Tax=Saprolegnia parasitica (strain CBS 223.65) TaxID=695850 RepID=A0A067BR20_SAPPC|nr:hypothetical protein SPRG_15244 [Saprolegnia parasitica CBS 223.65]KDO19225.1 hypothetical protein SPRG_15244 [Saprolegnia parasitica CBS 223.65]|eukprot:XP_012210059.1 hypothetical protein SPRG_15244 [Saprolegnia parasitica CBS 223.65]